jgi:hypothetical protein
MNVAVILGVIVAGVAGCVVTSLFVHWIAGAPMWAVARQWPKHVWSIIFAIPLPWLLAVGGAAGAFIAFVWLVAAPTVASKTYFGPKEAPWMRLFAFHSGYALAAMFAYALVTSYA